MTGPAAATADAGIFRELIEARREQLLDTAAAMVATPTITGSEDALLPLVEAWAREHGLRIDVTTLDQCAAASAEHFGAETRVAERTNVVVWLGDPESQPIVTLNAHIDVVPVPNIEDWNADPFSGARRDGWLHGRGAVDTKGGAAAALYALLALSELETPLPFALGVELVAAEESTGLGTRLTLEQRPDRLATVVIEPTRNELVTANSGILFFTIEIAGRAVHTSQPWRGVNAVEKAVRVFQALETLAQQRAESCRHPLMMDSPSAVPLVVGVFNGGGFRAAVPAHATLSGRAGVLPGEELDAVRAEIEAVLVDVAAQDPWLREHPPTLRWDSAGSPGWELPVTEPLPQSLLAGQRGAGVTEVYRGMNAGCDAGIIEAAGIPVVVFGPGDIALAHSSEEAVPENELVDAAVVLATALVDFAGRITGSAAEASA